MLHPCVDLKVYCLMAIFLKNRFSTDMLKDDPVKSLLILSFPVIILNILRAGYNIVDMFWLGKLGKEHLAGVSASIFLVWAMHGLSALVTVGIVAGISRNLGEGKIETARSNTWRSLKLAFALGIILTFFLYPLIDPLIGMIGLEPVAHKAGIEYLRIMMSSVVAGFMLFSLHSVMIAWGDTKTPVKVYLATFVFNIVASPILMFGVGPFPRLETKGAAIATVVSYVLGGCIFISVIIRNKWIVFKEVGQEIPFKRYISVGYPVALSGMFFSIIYYFIAKITAAFGSDAVGAMGVGHKVEALAYFFSQGVAAGLSTFVGRNLGAGFEDRAKIGAVAAIKYTAIVSGTYSLITFIFAPFIVSIFNSDPGLVAQGTNYLRIVMPIEILQSVLIVIEVGAFAGSGYTKPSFAVSLPVTFLRIPLAWFLAVQLGLEATGVWMTIALTMSVNSLIFIALFKNQKWLKAKV
jgi:putative MATE family efflux protein